MKECSLEEFYGIHSGQVAWLFGKGPSLSEFDFDDAGEIRGAINDVAGIVPGVSYGFANDKVDDWVDVYEKTPEDFVLFSCFRTAKNSKKPSRRVVPFADRSNERHWRLSAKEKAQQGLAVGHGTLASALQVFQVMGISTIVCVGIDGGRAHSDRSQWRTRLRHDHGKTYDRIRTAFIYRAHELGIEVRFFNGRDQPLGDGMKRIQITSNCAVRGVHYSTGEVHDFPENEANLLILNRRGRSVPEVKERKIVEAAVIEPPKVEDASAEPTKKVAAKKVAAKKE